MHFYEFVRIVIAIINFVVFVVVRQLSKDRRFKFSQSWAAITVGSGLGHIFYDVPEWVYGLSSDFTALWVGLVFVITGLVMFYMASRTRVGERQP